MEINTQLFTLLNSAAGQSRVLDFFIIFCATHLWWICTIGLLVFALYRRRDSDLKNLVAIYITATTAYLLAFVIKHIVSEPRPILSVTKIIPLVLRTGYDSFPSGHTAFMVGLAVASFIYGKKVGKVISVCAILVAIGRVVSGAHYPLDILGGALLGSIVGLILSRTSIANRFFAKSL